MDLFDRARLEKQVRPILEYLRSDFDKYPYEEVKDLAYFLRLLGDFSDLNVFEELKQYHAWTLDQPETKKIYYRSRFRSWLMTSVQMKLHPKHRPYWMIRAQFSR